MKIRSRGPLVWTYRLSGFAVGLAVLLSVLVGSASMAWLLAFVGIEIAWQLWLCRPGIRVTSQAVVLRGLLADTSIPIESITGFKMVRNRNPLDQLSRSVKLGVETRDGSVILCRWFQWQDLISPWISMGERPLSKSQRRLLETLNSHVRGCPDGAIKSGIVQ